ncbi:hypothetical protein ADUPG1_005806, partial [Aduncisulcus paluster]
MSFTSGTVFQSEEQDIFSLEPRMSSSVSRVMVCGLKFSFSLSCLSSRVAAVLPILKA